MVSNRQDLAYLQHELVNSLMKTAKRNYRLGANWATNACGLEIKMERATLN